MALHFERHDHVALITIDRPERLNALDAEHYQLLSQAWTQVRDDSQIRAAVITGAGERSFCSGADLKSFVGVSPSPSEFWLTQRDQLLNRGLEVWKPVVAAVNGYCLGAGLTLLFATDIRLAVPHASFSLPEVKRGVFPANGGTQRLLAQLPYPIAMEMLLTGEAMDAPTAARWGLVNRVVERPGLIDAALAVAGQMASNAPLAVQAAKELAVRSRDLTLADGLRMEQAMLRILDGTADVREGTRAFAEGREANFSCQ
jgi:E-phenylitaconyl-CoA hydratase